MKGRDWRMTRTTGYLCVIVSSIVLLAANSAAQTADLILRNGKVVTVDANFSVAQSVAVRGNQIAAVGTDSDVMKLAGPNTQVLDLKGRTVIPGLIDTHRHIHGEAQSDYGGDWTPEMQKVYKVDWRGVRTKDDVLNQVKGLMDKYQFKPGEWIHLINQMSLVGLEGGSGQSGSASFAKIIMDDLNRWELDKVTPNNPVAMNLGIPEFMGGLVNSKAVDILWARHGDVIKKYGRFWIDNTGRPDGHLEPPASRLLLSVVPAPDPADLAPLYKKNIEELNASGITTVSTRLPQESAAAYKLLDSRGELTLRMGYGMEWVFGNLPNLDNSLQALAGNIGSGGDKVWITSIAPTAIDGAATRACTNQKRQVAFGVIDRWWPVGQCQTDSEFNGAAGKGAPIQGNYFREWTINSGRYGVRFANTHVAGDRSVGNLLNFVEEIKRQYGPEAAKNWAVDHCVLVNPKDFQRASRLGVFFSCAPKYLEDVAPAAAVSYGEQVANTFIVPVKSLLNAGARVVFETDRNVFVWYDIELFLTRKDKRGKVWGPQEKLDKPTALRTATRWAADYILKGDKLGSLEPGKLADLVVLDRDYLTIPDEDVSEVRPQVTIVDGKIIYLHPQFAQEYNLRPSGAVVGTYEELKARRKPGGFAGGGG